MRYEVVWVYKTQQIGSFRTLLRFLVFFIIITTLSLLRGNKSNFYFLWIREGEKAIHILPKWNMAIIISYRVAYKRLFQLMKVKLNKNLCDVYWFIILLVLRENQANSRFVVLSWLPWKKKKKKTFSLFLLHFKCNQENETLEKHW